jgi:hypothetical protein
MTRAVDGYSCNVGYGAVRADPESSLDWRRFEAEVEGFVASAVTA